MHNSFEHLLHSVHPRALKELKYYIVHSLFRTHETAIFCFVLKGFLLSLSGPKLKENELPKIVTKRNLSDQ